MKKKLNHSSIASVLTLLMSLAFVSYFYGDILLSPNDYQFSARGDGMKNYYTYAYHIKHDASITAFGGMNYPYGEHFLYTDCHPFFTIILQEISTVYPGISNYSIGIVNLFMLLSFILTSLFLFLLFKELKVHPYLGALGAIGIMALAPQVFRMGGHLSLSYSFFIPLTFLLTLKTYTNPKNLRWPVLQTLNIFFWFFIHAYLGMMAVFFVASFTVIHFFLHYKEVSKKRSTYIRFLLWVILPLLIFRIFILITDTHEYRTDNPSGFFLNNAEPDDFLVPQFPPLRPFINSITKVNQKWEAWSYIGLTSVLVLLFIIINTVKNLIKHKRFIFSKKSIEHHEFKIAVWSSVVLLVFALGFPFKSFPFLLDWFPPVKQFRATARFVWVFYFAITTMSVVVLSNLLIISKYIRWKRFFYVIAFSGVLFYFFEGKNYHSYNGKILSETPNLFVLENNEPQFIELFQKINFNAYQAILPIPYYYLGSENFSLPRTDAILKNSLLYSYYTGLPILSAYLTRTGIWESRNIVQVISPGYYKKMIKNDIPSSKPFLILVTNDQVGMYEEMLLDRAKYLYSNDQFAIYEISPERLFENTAPSEISHFNAVAGKLISRDNFLVSDSSWFYFNDFEHYSSPVLFNGEGTFQGKKREDTPLIEFGPGTFNLNQEYTVSAWMYNGQQDALNFWFRLFVEEYDETEDKYYSNFVLPEQSYVIDGDWSLVEIDFKIKNPENKVFVKLLGKSIDKKDFYLDDLLIRNKKTEVYRIDATNTNGEITELFKNNQRVRLNQH
ncbi:MAG: hypothetical protein K9G76_06960 [Bacteroidales bacterium]|nr:hypothetical protein [Bacteroidales bacterium]MCF8404282.1 hypothetical protein [Bacteroidales bacterium]